MRPTRSTRNAPQRIRIRYFGSLLTLTLDLDDFCLYIGNYGLSIGDKMQGTSNHEPVAGVIH